MEIRNTGDHSYEPQPAPPQPQPQPQPLQPAPQPYYAPPTAPQHPTIRRRTAIIVGIGALLLGVGIGAAGKNSKTTNTAAAQTPAAAPAMATTTATASVTASVTATVTKAQAAAAPAPVKVTVTQTAPPPTTAAASSISDGTYVVGTDIKPGLYKTTGPSDPGGLLPDCYWERDRDLSGGMDSIIANDNAKGPTTVQIGSGDKAFKTSGCAPWVKIG